MVGVRYSARSPRAFAIEGLGIFASDAPDIALPDICLFAGTSVIPSDEWSNVRAHLESACRVGQSEPVPLPAWRQSLRSEQARTLGEPMIRQGGCL